MRESTEERQIRSRAGHNTRVGGGSVKMHTLIKIRLKEVRGAAAQCSEPMCTIGTCQAPAVKPFEGHACMHAELCGTPRVERGARVRAYYFCGLQSSMSQRWGSLIC